MADIFIDPRSRNTLLNFFPSMTWEFKEVDKDNLEIGNTTGAFNWLQVFFNASMLTVPPQLVVFTGGHFNIDGTPLGSIVEFSFSGQMQPIKGTGILSSGKDIRGVTHTSTVIGSDATLNLVQVIAYGGMY